MYLLDANAIITPFHQGPLGALAKALGKSPNEAKAHLEAWFRDGIKSGLLRLGREVRDEVLRKRGPGYDLLKSLDGQYKLLEVTEVFFDALAKVAHFVREHYAPEGAEPFLRGADPTLVALAKAHNLILITQERHELPELDGVSGLMKGRPRLPYVAFAFGVRCVPLMTALLEVQGQASLP
ncbi:hypothetical protein TthHC11_02920 [Thermus thermophilus]|uniref:DUF4411 family protein n=1 Tax=Thermus thermophilus TaxID=274 RepID=UPI001162F9CC|nr:DUF4411 family protein [Thermus thermophilus]BBL92758.1 hypothetical protein TthHC11_02920 [Thermus thermophilus]